MVSFNVFIFVFLDLDLHLDWYSLGYPQVAWELDQDGRRVTWTHLYTRLAAAAIFILVGETTPRILNPLVGSLLHYNELARQATSGFLAVHSVGGGAHSLACLADTLAWVATPPVA